MLYVNRLSVEDSGWDPKGDVEGIDCFKIEDNVKQNMNEVPIDEYEIEDIEILKLTFRTSQNRYNRI